MKIYNLKLWGVKNMYKRQRFKSLPLKNANIPPPPPTPTPSSMPGYEHKETKINDNSFTYSQF